MARFSVGGDEDGNEERPTNRPSPKRTRTSTSPVNESRHRRSVKPCHHLTVADLEYLFGGTSRPQELVTADEESERQSSEGSETESSSEEENEDTEEQQTERSGDDVELPEARADPIASGSDAWREIEGSISVTLSDPDVLDCPICYEPLCSPVYQCENGHIACASCCTTMKNKCANCCWPIGYSRCRAFEKVLESVKVTCRNMQYGCQEKFSYSKKLAHEKACTYTPCSCPHIGCDYIGMSRGVYAHFFIKHSHSSKQFQFKDVISISLDQSQKYVFLQERILGTLFILNRSYESDGSFVNVVCVAPTSEKSAFLYDLTATVGESSVKLKSSVDIMPNWTAQPPANIYLIVPSHFISKSGVLKLELAIWKNPVHLT